MAAVKDPVLNGDSGLVARNKINNGMAGDDNFTDLNDVDLTTNPPVTNDLIQFNGATWLPFDLFAANNIWAGINTYTDQIINTKGQNSDVDFANAHIKLLPTTVINNVGNTTIAMGMSTLDNFGWSLNSLREFTTDSSAKFTITFHNGTAVGSDVLVLEDTGLTILGEANIFGNLNVSANITSNSREVWSDQANFRTAASAAVVVDDAEAGHIGVIVPNTGSLDLENLVSGFHDVPSGTNVPTGSTRPQIIGHKTDQGRGLQLVADSINDNIFYRVQNNSTWKAYQEIWHDAGTGRTAANAATVVTNAETSNIGKSSIPAITDADTFLINGFTRVITPFTNTPTGTSTALQTNMFDINTFWQIAHPAGSDTLYFRTGTGATFLPWQEILHDGNIGVASFNGISTPAGVNRVEISPVNAPRIIIENTGTSLNSSMVFKNANDDVGTIATSGTTTAYNTSSDPRLKDFKPPPTDLEIDIKFYEAYSTFAVFNFKADPDLEVWGFDAHAAIDAGLDFASEGEGPRDLKIGEVYKTTEDENGETIEHKVTPAGVDQGKLTPILMAKVEQQDRVIRQQAEQITGLQQQIDNILLALNKN